MPGFELWELNHKRGLANGGGSKALFFKRSLYILTSVAGTTLKEQQKYE